MVNLLNMLLDTGMKHGTKNSITRHAFNWSSSYEELTKPANSGFYLRNKYLF